MKITFVVASADLSGGCRVIAIHARLLRERGHEVLVVAPAARAPTLRERARALFRRAELPGADPSQNHFVSQGIPIKRLERARAITAADLPEADVIVATWWETAEWIRDLPPNRGAKVHFVQGWERYIEGQPGERVDAVLRLPTYKIVISKYLQSVLEDRFDQRDVTLAPNAIDPLQFDAAPRGKQAHPTLGFVYSTSQWKGPDVCRAAIERVLAEIPDLRILAFGAEKPIPSCPLPTGTQLEHRPNQRRIPEIYASADVWLSASRLEGFGLPALEAMACRTPLVSTRYGGPMGLVRDGENGYLVDVEDSEALAARAIRVLSMAAPDWKRMSDAAHRTAHAHSWGDSSRAFEAGLRRALERRSDLTADVRG